MNKSGTIDRIFNFISSKTIIWIVFLTATLICLEKPINSFLDIHVVIPFLKECKQDSVAVDIIFIVIIILVLLIYGYKISTKYITSNSFNFIILFIGFIYLFYRFIDPMYLKRETWFFYRYTFISSIAYADIIVISFALHLILLIRNYIQQKKLAEHNSSLTNTSIFTIEQQWKTNKTDHLERKKAATFLAKELVKINHDKSFAVGITGSWGSGKTYFMDILKEELELNKNIITIEFNPWRSSSSELIITDFFKSMKEILSEYSAEISSQLDFYAEKLSQADNTKVMGIIKDLLIEKESLESSYHKIDNSIKKIGAKIAIFIDDLDRLHENEIIEVIRLIRNTANFNNTIFVLAYDKSYVNKAIENGINSHNSDVYLDKIIQLEICTPIIKQNFLKNTLFELLIEKIITNDSKITAQQTESIKAEISKAIWPQQNYSALDSFLALISVNTSKDNKYASYDFFKDYIKNFRDVYRFSNSITYSYFQMRGEIAFDDLYHIELLKLKAIDVYNLIKERQLIEEDFSGNQNSLKTKYVYKESIHLDLPKTSQIPEKIIKNTLSSIFPNTTPTHSRSITIPDFFPIYFSTQLFDNISLVKFEEYRKLPLSNFLEHIKNWVSENKTTELLNVVYNIKSFNGKDDVKKIATLLHDLFISVEHFEIENFLSHFENENIARTVGTDSEEDKNDLKEFLKSLLSGSDSVVQDSGLISMVLRKYIYKKEKEDYQFIIPFDELLDLNISYLDKYTSGRYSVDPICFKLYQNCIEDINTSSTIILSPKANKIFREFILKNPENYFNYLIVPTQVTEHSHIIEPFVPQTFSDKIDDYSEFEKFLISQKGKNLKVDEVERFYKVFKENNFRQFEYLKEENIHYAFKHQDPPQKFPENNDDVYSRIFDLAKYNFEIIINAHGTAFWRFGFIFSTDHSFPAKEMNRHSDKRFPYIHLNIGDEKNGKWEMPNPLRINEYQIEALENEFVGAPSINSSQTVSLQLTHLTLDKVMLEIFVDQKSVGHKYYDLRNYKYCKIAAWCDNNYFNLSTRIKITDIRFL